MSSDPGLTRSRRRGLRPAGEWARSITIEGGCISGEQSSVRLAEEDIEHYQRIVVALKVTMRLMEEIDEVIDEHGGWPIE
jgi:hypothetical protein